ncbi:hypothetical protein [Kitasatospora viridis]|uniref:Uncharacterized protein n=1 Tax=Kitasatospora viridis TaxID=281105 RepID=A0A561UD78_9ACTN|nr:hypothetical protein [Kitasatospora viridis]TWF97311.1 hypothetical protein FHX73_111091 [Kitasatospora viridis]
MSDRGVSDDQWAEFVNNHRVMSGLAEPGQPAAGPPAGPVRRVQRKAVLAAVGAVLAIGGLTAYGMLASPKHEASPLQANRPAPRSTGSPHPSAAPAGLGFFLPQFGGYTLVADKALPSCVERDTTGPTLAGLLTQSAGCTELDIALYRDQAGDQFNLALFRMKDPTDCPHIIDALASDPTDYEVGAEVPPDSSGLRTLPADSGMVQAFESYGTSLMVGLGQWADGHSGDFNTLEDKTHLLVGDVMRQLGAPVAPDPSTAPSTAPSAAPSAGAGGGGPVQSV